MFRVGHNQDKSWVGDQSGGEGDCLWVNRGGPAKHKAVKAMIEEKENQNVITWNNESL